MVLFAIIFVSYWIAFSDFLTNLDRGLRRLARSGIKPKSFQTPAFLGEMYYKKAHEA